MMAGPSAHGPGPPLDARLAFWSLGRRRLPGPLLPVAALALLILGLRLPALLTAAGPAMQQSAPVRMAPPPSPLPAALEASEAEAPDPRWPEPAGGPPADPKGGPDDASMIEADAICPATPAAIADVALEAVRRRDAVLKLEKEVAAREAAQKAEAARLAALGAELDRRAARARTEDEARVAQLVKVYEAMKPKDAAQVLERLAMPVLLPIALHMREVRLAPILAAMDPAKAQAVTVALAAPASP